MEDVWKYPRPPALEPVARPVRIEFAGRVVAATDAAFRVLETSHPPVYYLPRAAFTCCTLEPARGSSFCEWKGAARYWTIRAGDRAAERAAWSYPPGGGLRRHPGPPGGVRRRHGPVLRGRRGGHAAARRLLRRLDHERAPGAVQGWTRHHGLVRADDVGLPRSCFRFLGVGAAGRLLLQPGLGVMAVL